MPSSQPRNAVQCPQCGASVDVNAVLHHQIESQIRQDYDRKLSELEDSYTEQSRDIEKQRRQLEWDKEQAQEEMEQRVKRELKRQQAQMEERLQQEAKAAAEKAQKAAMEVLQAEIVEKSQQVQEFNKLSAEFERLKRDKNEQEEQIRAAAEKEFTAKLDERLAAERSQLQQAANEKYELKIREMEKQLEDQKKLTEEMQAKQEQGSMQLQGEVQELAIEAWLRTQFPLDTVDEVKKGAYGGDCIHTVHTRSRQNCGKVYYESKRTKDFSDKWIEKLRTDMMTAKANVGVIVTQTMPDDMDRMGLRNGIWVCTFEEFKGLCKVLRESIVQLDMAIATQENRGDKMVMLYEFLTGPEFKSHVEIIGEGFKKMREDLEREKRAMNRIWKEREKQLDKVLLGTAGLYGSVQGIAGNVVESLPSLELPEG